MNEEEYFVRFAAALYAAFRTDSKQTTAARDIQRALSEARILAHVAQAVKKTPLDKLDAELDRWRQALEAQA